MSAITNFLFTPELSQIFLGTIAGITLFFFACAYFFPKVRQKTENKAMKKTLARSTKFPAIFSILFVILLLLRLENSDIWIGWRLWIIALTLFAFFWIFRKVRFFLGEKKRIDSAEKRRKGKR